MRTEIMEASDEELSTAAGGRLAGGDRVNYLAAQIMPVIYGLSGGASAGDRAILETICGTLRSAMMPGADAAAVTDGLWKTYHAFYRSALQSGRIQATLDQTLNSLRQYMEEHG